MRKPELLTVAEDLAKALGKFMKASDTSTADLDLLHSGSEALSKWADWKRDNGLAE